MRRKTTSNNKNQKWTWLLAAAVSVTVAGMSMGQYRVGNDGRAHDANTRIGSMGLNNTPAPQGNQQYNNIGNYLITGNVTGGREFRGFVPYTDPTAFRGTTASALSDKFIRESSGAPFGGVQNNNAQVVQPIFSQGRYETPPPNFTSQSPSNGVSIPAVTMMRAPGDLRLGDAIAAPSTNLLPLPGQLMLPGPLDPNTQTNSLITASPLYGVRRWDLSGQADLSFLSNTVGPSVNNGALSRMDPGTLDRLRSELLSPNGPIDNSIGSGTLGTGTTDQQNPATPDRGQPNGAPLPAPLESPQNDPLVRGTAVDASAVNSGAMANTGAGTGAGIQRRLLSPRQQSTQYDELSKRLQQYRIVQEMADSQAQRELQRQLREQQEQQQPQQGKPQQGKTQPDNNTNRTPGGASTPPSGMQQPTNPGAAPGALPTTPGQPQPSQPNKVEIPGTSDMAPTMSRPVQIKSLAEGVQAKGLGDLLSEAESQLKSGKYNSALEDYDMAEQVAPNNPLILMGRANVELARTYYTRAEANLRKAFLQDQALLMGQYDLRSMIGDERLDFLVKDLKEIAQREQKEPRPVLLLAYIAYNTGNERRAAAYLDLAEKRAGAGDPLYPLIRKHWSLPKDAGQNPNDALNK